ncbi:hypothetical protein EDC01DRAFT_750928 [Geopyxis carbonaria]|nr:hypothetical protein EDC01DRAFT_750928 [Geopyxis carbonaria]
MGRNGLKISLSVREVKRARNVCSCVSREHRAGETGWKREHGRLRLQVRGAGNIEMPGILRLRSCTVGPMVDQSSVFRWRPLIGSWLVPNWGVRLGRIFHPSKVFSVRLLTLPILFETTLHHQSDQHHPLAGQSVSSTKSSIMSPNLRTTRKRKAAAPTEALPAAAGLNSSEQTAKPEPEKKAATRKIKTPTKAVATPAIAIVSGHTDILPVPEQHASSPAVTTMSRPLEGTAISPEQAKQFTPAPVPVTPTPSKKPRAIPVAWTLGGFPKRIRTVLLSCCIYADTHRYTHRHRPPPPAPPAPPPELAAWSYPSFRPTHLTVIFSIPIGL